jgi:hypothetical protein
MREKNHVIHFSVVDSTYQWLKRELENSPFESVNEIAWSFLMLGLNTGEKRAKEKEAREKARRDVQDFIDGKRKSVLDDLCEDTAEKEVNKILYQLRLHTSASSALTENCVKKLEFLLTENQTKAEKAAL